MGDSKRIIRILQVSAVYVFKNVKIISNSVLKQKKYLFLKFREGGFSSAFHTLTSFSFLQRFFHVLVLRQLENGGQLLDSALEGRRGRRVGKRIRTNREFPFYL